MRCGTVSAQYSYSTYGLPTNTSNDAYMFTGRRYDFESGLYHYRNRSYNAPLGRFMQPDPIGTAGGINLYEYAGGDPINKTDAMGTNPGLIALALAGAAVALELGIQIYHNEDPYRAYLNDGAFGSANSSMQLVVAGSAGLLSGGLAPLVGAGGMAILGPQIAVVSYTENCATTSSCSGLGPGISAASSLVDVGGGAALEKGMAKFGMSETTRNIADIGYGSAVDLGSRQFGESGSSEPAAASFMPGVTYTPPSFGPISEVYVGGGAGSVSSPSLGQMNSTGSSLK